MSKLLDHPARRRQRKTFQISRAARPTERDEQRVSSSIITLSVNVVCRSITGSKSSETTIIRETVLSRVPNFSASAALSDKQRLIFYRASPFLTCFRAN